MKKKSSGRKSKTKKSNSNGTTKTTDEKPTTWVDRVMEKWLDVDRIDNGPEKAKHQHISVGIVCWNVLADSYCSPRSHRHLPLVYQRHIFDRHQRQHHVRRILKRFTTERLGVDLIALQEVDAPLQVPQCMKECGFEGHHTPSDPSGKNGRVDSCALYYKSDVWTSIEVECISLDDLATLCSKNGIFTPSTRASLMETESNFLRKNVALLVRLKHIETKQEVVVAVAHLFWNPLYQDVKLCQAHYVTLRAHAFAKGNAPIIFAGDTNSQPGGPVHEYFSKGSVDAKAVAPWYNQDPMRYQANPFDTGRKTKDDNDIAQSLGNMSLVNAGVNSSASNIETIDSPQSPRYLLDFTLNRLCRWLRILGIDAGLETDDEERMRTKDGKMSIFDRCRKERRTLITSSNRLAMRKDCPAGTYRLDTKALSNLELSLVHLLLSHGVELRPKNFLTICVVCNGRIDRITDKGAIEGIFIAHKAPDNLVDQNLKVWQCNGCQQGYWYDERPTSSASRVKNQASKLLTLCIRGGVPVIGDMGLFDFMNVDDIRKVPSIDINDEELCSLKDQQLDILEWLQQEDLKNPLGAMRSAYADNDGQEGLPFTNVTSDFVGHLDYIFYDSSNFEVEKRLYAPRSFEELQDNTAVRNGHLLPSNVWPSDHLAIGAVLTLLTPVELKEEASDEKDIQLTPEEPTQESTLLPIVPSQKTLSCAFPPTLADQFCLPMGSIPKLAVSSTAPRSDSSTKEQPEHGKRCDCGCVPNVMSLFEMAEARRKAREARRKKQLE